MLIIVVIIYLCLWNVPHYTSLLPTFMYLPGTMYFNTYTLWLSTYLFNMCIWNPLTGVYFNREKLRDWSDVEVGSIINQQNLKEELKTVLIR